MRGLCLSLLSSRALPRPAEPNQLSKFDQTSTINFELVPTDGMQMRVLIIGSDGRQIFRLLF